jgi:selenide,water dikinase
MSKINSIGEQLGEISGVNAMTDITGFGLLGHLTEMAEGSGFSAELFYNDVPIMEGAREYLAQRIVPDATYRNWNSYSKTTSFEKGVNVMEAFNLLPDPQTNGGLLISVKESFVQKVVDLFKKNNLADYIKPIGRIIERREKIVEVKN